MSERVCVVASAAAGLHVRERTTVSRMSGLRTVYIGRVSTSERVAAWERSSICTSVCTSETLSALMKKASTMPPERSAGIALSMKQTMPTGSIRAQ